MSASSCFLSKNLKIKLPFSYKNRLIRHSDENKNEPIIVLFALYFPRAINTLTDNLLTMLFGRNTMKSITLKATTAAILLTLFGSAATFQSASADNSFQIRAIPGLKLIHMGNMHQIKRPRIRTCGGHAITMWGTSGADYIVGTPGRDVIYAGAGNDRVDGRGGNDIICGGRGNDTLNGNRGNDRMYGGRGHDTMKGNRGKDTLYGGRGEDRMYGGKGKDKMFGGKNYDRMEGGPGRDYLNGGVGNNGCNGGPGHDTLVNC